MNTTTLHAPATLHEAHPGAAPDEQDEAASAAPIRELGPEMAVSGLLMALGGLVVFDSVRLGAGWADDGPQSGYFPFYIGLMLLASSGVVCFRAIARWWAARQDDQADESVPVFVEREQLNLVMAMFVPASLYVAAMAFTGLYVASIALIAWFMRRHGRFNWALSTVVSVGVPLTVFVVFERWFLVPLPKGPIEALLGF